jgi:NADH-quinone oxidoreductase subunit N
MDYLRRRGSDSGEYYVLVLFATAGMMLHGRRGDLVVVFLALELMSLSLYVLAGLFKRELASGEASMKYFLLGAFASSFLLYGIALIYGAADTTSLDRIAAAMTARPARPLFVIGLGSCWSVSASRSRRCPSTCGCPTSIRGAHQCDRAHRHGLEGRRLRGADPGAGVVRAGSRPTGRPSCGPSRPCTMTIGNVVAIAQSNLKRMLAYSSIAHVGYMLVGLVAGGAAGTGSVLFYLLVLRVHDGRRVRRDHALRALARRGGGGRGLRRALPGAIRCWRRRSACSSSRWSAFRPWPASSASSTCSARRCAPATSGSPSSAC